MIQWGFSNPFYSYKQKSSIWEGTFGKHKKISVKFSHRDFFECSRQRSEKRDYGNRQAHWGVGGLPLIFFFGK